MNILDVSPRLLRVFVDLCNTSSISKTGENLGLSQPSVSRHLATLRDALNDQLFVAHGRGVRPTPTALLLLPRVESLLISYERLASPQRTSPAKMSGIIRMATTDYGAMFALPKALSEISEQAPNLGVEVFPLDNDLFVKLLDGRLDFAFFTDYATHEGIEHFDLFEEHHEYIVSRTHPLSERKNIRRADIERYPRLLVNIIGDRYTFVDDRAIGKASPKVWLPYFTTAPFLVADTDLVMSAPSRLANKMLNALDLKILPISPNEPPFKYRLIWAKQVTDDPMLNWVKQTIINAN